MRSRIAISLMLVLGLFLSVSGAGLAVTGLSSKGSAAKAQYGNDDNGNDDNGNDDNNKGDDDDTTVISDDDDGDKVVVLPQSSSSPPPAPPEDNQEVLGEEETNPSAGVAPTEQVQNLGAQQLPFTGYAAIPIMLLGLALLTAGLLTRRSVRREVTQE